ncbi:MAG: hypothetical protein Q8L04_02080 [Ignavibacteria bacterium]|nr:hypothetical protein [Ignavibacteria bacterium]
MEYALSKYGALSIISVIVTAVLTFVHHFYEIGFLAVILVLLFIVTPILLMQQLRNTRKKVFLWLYGLLNTWLVIGLGLVDGLFNHTFKLLSFQVHVLLALHGGSTKVVEKTFEGNLIYEGTGVLTFVTGIFAAYYGYKFIRTGLQSSSTSANN